MRARVVSSGRNALRGAGLGALLLLTLGCGRTGPRPIVAGDDACHFCRMEISDPRFGTQVRTATGKIHVFDSVECLVGYLNGTGTSSDVVWVADAESPGTWVAAAEAGYLVDATLRSPMGRIVAFASPTAASAAQTRLGGTTGSWGAVRTDSGGIAAHDAPAHGGH